MSFVYIIRHAESEANIAFLRGQSVEGADRTDSMISERGHEQIRLLGYFLSNAFRGREVVSFTSPLQRALGTSRAMDVEAEVLEDLVEIRDLRSDDVEQRIYRVLDRIRRCREESPDRPVVLFTHSLFINALISVMLGESYNRRGRFDGNVRYYTGNTGISALQFKNNTWRLLAHNYLHHLPKDFVSGTPLLLMK